MVLLPDIETILSDLLNYTKKHESIIIVIFIWININ